jgi:hypothetical protein
MPPPPFFIVAVNLYLIYVLFKKPRANPRTMYYEEQNTKLVFELEGGPLTKDAFEETYKPKPKPMPVYSDNYIDKYLLKDSDIKEHIPKIEAVPDIVLNNVPEVVQDILQDIVLNNVPEVVQDILQDIVLNNVPEVVPDIVQDTLQEVVPDIVQDTLQEVVPDIVQDTLQEVVPDIVQDTLQEVVPDIVPEVVPEVVPTIYAKYFTNFDRIAFSQTNIKNYTVVVHYENKTSSISNSDYVQVIPIYMNVVALMNPK